jgi:hypothetical protein
MRAATILVEISDDDMRGWCGPRVFMRKEGK